MLRPSHSTLKSNTAVDEDYAIVGGNVFRRVVEGTSLAPSVTENDGEREEKTLGIVDDCGGNYRPPVQQSNVLRVPRGVRGVAKGGSKPIRTWMTYYAKTAGAANTAFAFFYTLRPNLDASFASYQQVFDEMKVLSAELHWQINMTVVPTAFAAQAPNAAVAYEPAYDQAVSPASVNEVLQYEKFSLAAVVPVNGGAFTYSTNAQKTTREGLTKFSCKVPNTPVQSEIDPLTSAGMWRPTADASNYYWGSFVGYCAQAGTTSVCQAEGFVRMLVELRCRR